MKKSIKIFGVLLFVLIAATLFWGKTSGSKVKKEDIAACERKISAAQARTFYICSELDKSAGLSASNVFEFLVYDPERVLLTDRCANKEKWKELALKLPLFEQMNFTIHQEKEQIYQIIFNDSRTINEQVCHD